MYGKEVTIQTEEYGIECKVFVTCTPGTPRAALQKLARAELRAWLDRQEAESE